MRQRLMTHRGMRHRRVMTHHTVSHAESASILALYRGWAAARGRECCRGWGMAAHVPPCSVRRRDGRRELCVYQPGEWSKAATAASPGLPAPQCLDDQADASLVSMEMREEALRDHRREAKITEGLRKSKSAS